MTAISHYFLQLLLTLGLGSLLLAAPIQAQEAAVNLSDGLRLVVSPPIIDLRTEPSSKATATFKIKNNNDQDENLMLELMKFVPDKSGAKPQLGTLGPNDVFPQWLNFSETQFSIAKKSWKSIDMAFNPPANAAPAYYFAIVVKRQAITEDAGSTNLDAAAAILVLVQVSSSRVYHQLDLQQLTSSGFDFRTKKIYEFLPVNFTTTLTNSGNVHEQAFGNIFIDWLSGNKTDVGIIDVNQEKSFILPQSSRAFTSSWTDGFPVWQEKQDAGGNIITDKKGQPKRKLHWDFADISSFRIGKFKATLLMIYNDSIRDIPLQAETTFWVIPWRILLVILILILLILLGFKGLLQKLWEKVKSIRQNSKYRSLKSSAPVTKRRPHL